MDAVGEVVEPQRVDVQPAGVLVERVHRGVAVARAGSAARRITPTTSSSLLSPGAARDSFAASARNVSRETSWKRSGWLTSIVSASSLSSRWSGVGGRGSSLPAQPARRRASTTMQRILSESMRRASTCQV